MSNLIRPETLVFTPPKTTRAPAIRSQAPAQVDGEVLSSRVRLPVFRTYIRPAFVNLHENKPDTFLQALAPVCALAVPVAVTFLFLWVYFMPLALVATGLFFAVNVGVVCRPSHSVGQILTRLCKVLFLYILFAPSRGIAHCCCKLVRF
jgi:hypothetical protein